MYGYLDYKATIWCRIPIKSNDALKRVQEKIEANILPSELYNDLDSDNDVGRCEILYETEEFISPNENDGNATIEIWDDEGNFIWDNSYESEIKRKYEYSFNGWLGKSSKTPNRLKFILK